MTATTQGRDPQLGIGDYAFFNTASGETIYEGTLVMVNASGLAVAAVDNSANAFVGIATGYTACGTNTATAGTLGVDGSASVRVKRTGTALVNFSGTATLADIGKTAACVDNATVALLADASGDVVAGLIVEVPSSTTVRIDMTGWTTQAK